MQHNCTQRPCWQNATNLLSVYPAMSYLVLVVYYLWEQVLLKKASGDSRHLLPSVTSSCDAPSLSWCQCAVPVDTHTVLREDQAPTVSLGSRKALYFHLTPVQMQSSLLVQLVSCWPILGPRGAAPIGVVKLIKQLMQSHFHTHWAFLSLCSPQRMFISLSCSLENWMVQKWIRFVKAT
jgi:hypothetical protein